MSPDRNIAHSRRRPFSLAAAVVLWRVVAPLASAQSVTNPAAALTNLASTNINAALPGQIVSTNTPPLPPRQYNPDPGNPPFRTNLVVPEKIYRLNRITNSGPPPLSPGVFNPDPGSMLRPPANPAPSFFTNQVLLPPLAPDQTLPPRLALPRTNVYGEDLEMIQPPTGTNYGVGPLPPGLDLPRTNVRANPYLQRKWDSAGYPPGQGYSIPPFSEPTTNRWRIGFVPWRRYTSGDIETPYETPAPLLWDPYRQSLLKGDAPVIGQNIFST